MRRLCDGIDDALRRVDLKCCIRRSWPLKSGVQGRSRSSSVAVLARTGQRQLPRTSTPIGYRYCWFMRSFSFLRCRQAYTARLRLCFCTDCTCHGESCNGLYVDGPPGQAKATQSYCCQNSARRFSSALDDRLLTPQRAVVVEDRDPVRREDEVGTSRGRHSLDEVEDRLLGRAIVPGRKRGCGRITLHGWSCHSRLIS